MSERKCQVSKSLTALRYVESVSQRAAREVPYDLIVSVALFLWRSLSVSVFCSRFGNCWRLEVIRLYLRCFWDPRLLSVILGRPRSLWSFIFVISQSIRALVSFSDGVLVTILLHLLSEVPVWGPWPSVPCSMVQSTLSRPSAHGCKAC